MANIITITTVLGSLATNCYLVANTDTRETVIIDPADRADYISKVCNEQNFKPVAILLTHGHADHMGALAKLRESYKDITVYAGAEDEIVMKNPAFNLSEMIGFSFTAEADKYIKDNDVLKLLGTNIRCIHVPGHTQGGICYYFEEEKLLFTGDTLFHFSIGRSDFPTGNGSALIENIEKKLLVLPDDVLVYPGHNDRTTIGREKNGNPYF